jgi:hypothetical protein
MPPEDPDFSDHECVIEEMFGEYKWTCRCGKYEWHPTAEYADLGVEDHQSGRKRRRHAPLDRKYRDKVLALASAPPERPAGVLFSCQCKTWKGTQLVPILFRGPVATMKKRCFICRGKKIREPEEIAA